MEQNTKQSNCIGIVGLGLIGGSLGLDLQSLGWTVHGLTHRQLTVNKAKERKLAQVISTDPKILSNCSLVIIALPLAELLKPEPELINALPKSAVITDVGSVKTPVLKVWRKLHPRFIGSHPMAGTAKAGVEAGTKNLFNQRPWISTPEESTDNEALEIVHQLALSLGSQWITAKAEMHDQAVALISHLPVLVSAALLKTIRNEENSSLLALAKDLASSGFADTTRVGGGNPKLGTAMMSNNTAEILRAITSYRSSLEAIEKIILREQWKELESELEKTQAIRPDFV